MRARATARLAASTLSLALLAAPLQASREGGVAYDVTIAGIPIGEAQMTVARENGRYVLTGAADVGFLFWGGNGVAVAEGREADGRFLPERYRLSYEGVSRPGAVAIDFEDGAPARWDREPPIPPEYAEGRTPLAPERLIGALDPLTALAIPAGEGVAPEALCSRILPVFSGYTRFDLALTGASRVEGGAVACAARYVAVAGHRENSSSVERMSRPDALKVALAPIAEGVWGPARIEIATRFGPLEIARR